LWLNALVIALDLGTKQWPPPCSANGNPVPVMPLFKLYVRTDTGAAF